MRSGKKSTKDIFGNHLMHPPSPNFTVYSLPTNKDTLSLNHVTVIKIRRLTLTRDCLLILRPHSSFAGCLTNALHSQSIQFRILCYRLWWPCLLSLLQSVTVSPS